MSYRDLANAVRKGAQMRPQRTEGGYMRDGCSCAIGAAAEALGVPYIEGTGCGFLLSEKGYDRKIINKVSDMNDIEKMTREQIADWLDSLEPKPQRESDTAYYVRQMAEIQRVAEDA